MGEIQSGFALPEGGKVTEGLKSPGCGGGGGPSGVCGSMGPHTGLWGSLHWNRDGRNQSVTAQEILSKPSQ